MDDDTLFLCVPELIMIAISLKEVIQDDFHHNLLFSA